jgi:type IV pilus assembly protein PilA
MDLEEVHMFKAIHDRLNRDEEGFTLIELMVVVLIIAILIAIAIPTFLGARSRAQDKQAQSNLRNALTAEKTYYVDNQAYSSDTAATGVLKGIETALNWGSTDASARGVDVNALGDAVNTGDNGCVILESLSKSGKDFFLMDIATGTGAGTYYGQDVASPACPAVDTAPGSAWGNSW